jgi:YfiH family protein
MTPQLLFYDFGLRVVAFSTTRHGGVSQGNYSSLNINAYCGDDMETVAENRRLLSLELPIPNASRIIVPHQVHDSVVQVIDEDTLGQQELIEGVDALITRLPGVCIGVSTADCIPIIICDPIHHCAAAVHAGWRGTVKRIVEKVAQQMYAFYRSDYGELQVMIGPGISLKNFEVGQEVYDEFLQAGFPMECIATKYAKWHIDLPLCNRLQLEQLGVRPENIRETGICTYDHADVFFSARRLGINSGRIFTGVILR